MSKFDYSAIDTQQCNRIYRFISQLKYDEIPPATRRYAALLLLDTLGVYIVAHPLEASRIARLTALKLFGPSAHSSMPLMFDHNVTSAAGFAFAGATQIDNLDAHDGFAPAKGHIGAALVPVILALTYPHKNQISGKDLIQSLIIGYEIASRAGCAIHATCHDYHTSGAWNVLGCIAAASYLKNLCFDATRQAFGIGEYHAPRSQMMREITHPTMLHDGSSMGACGAIMAVEMAEKGFQGAPSLLIEGKNAHAFWQDLKQIWYTNQQYIKPYPICRWAHAPIDGAIELRQRYQLKIEDIKRVDIYTFDEGIRLYHKMPASTAQAQYSLHFSLAKALQYGHIGIDEITGDALSCKVTENMITRIYAHHEPRHQKRFPEGRWAHIEITLNDGRLLKSGDIDAKGGKDTPLSQDEILDKFTRYASTQMTLKNTKK
ncbi:MAG: MmgE/PrpD family protein, partial [Pseudomonadota bacterium]